MTIINAKAPQVHLLLTFAQFQIILNIIKMSNTSKTNKEKKVLKQCFVNYCSCIILVLAYLGKGKGKNTVSQLFG